MAARLGFIALDGEIGIHRVAPGLRREQIGGAGIDRHHVAHLQPALPAHFAAQRRDQRQTARTGELHIFLVIVERGNGNAGQGPDIVEVHFAAEQIDQRLVRLWLRRRHDQLLFMGFRRTELRRAGIWAAGDAEAILMARNRGDAGEEGRAHRQQVAGRFQPLSLGVELSFNVHAVAAHRQRRCLLVHEQANAGLAAFGIDHGFAEQFGFTCEAGGHALRPARADRIDGALAGFAAAGPIELLQDALHKRIGQRVIQIDMAFMLPGALGSLAAFRPGAAQVAGVTKAHEFTHGGMS